MIPDWLMGEAARRAPWPGDCTAHFSTMAHAIKVRQAQEIRRRAGEAVKAGDEVFALGRLHTVTRQHLAILSRQRCRQKVRNYFDRMTAAGVAVSLVKPTTPWWRLRGWRVTWRMRPNGAV